MRLFHDRLARIGLEAVEKYGFVLAGGYAISANGMGGRQPMSTFSLIAVTPSSSLRPSMNCDVCFEPMGSSLPTTGSAPHSQTCT